MYIQNISESCFKRQLLFFVEIIYSGVSRIRDLRRYGLLHVRDHGGCSVHQD